MSGFKGFKGDLVFDQGIVRIIREEAPVEVLVETEKHAKRYRVLGVQSQKRTFLNFGHVAIIVDPKETEYKISNALNCPPNVVLLNSLKHLEAALPVVAEIEAAIASGQEIYFVNLDPSDVPAPALEKHAASPEWQSRAQAVKKTLLETHKDGYSFFIISVDAPEFPEGLYLQGSFPTPTKVYLELSNSENPPYNEEILSAIKKAGWDEPHSETPNFNKTVAWDDDDAITVANFLVNTLQWCLFLDEATVQMSHEITQDK